MSSRDHRIQDALSQLVERLLPLDEDEDESAADERYNRALEVAQNTLEDANAPSVVADEGHIADLIRRQCENQDSSSV